MDKLNLGCGTFKKDGFINMDSDVEAAPDLLYNLNNLPYPFNDNSFSLIEANHVLEHLENPFDVMKEIYRILRPDGKVIIRVPHFSRGFTHPSHKRGFDVSFPLYFNKKYSGFYSGTSFHLKKMSFKWFAQPYLKKISLPPYQFYIGIIIGGLLDFLANLSPYFCSRIWCYWIGGFEEIEFVFTTNKSTSAVQ